LRNTENKRKLRSIPHGFPGRSTQVNPGFGPADPINLGLTLDGASTTEDPWFGPSYLTPPTRPTSAYGPVPVLQPQCTYGSLPQLGSLSRNGPVQNYDFMSARLLLGPTSLNSAGVVRNSINPHHVPTAEDAGIKLAPIDQHLLNNLKRNEINSGSLAHSTDQGNRVLPSNRANVRFNGGLVSVPPQKKQKLGVNSGFPENHSCSPHNVSVPANDLAVFMGFISQMHLRQSEQISGNKTVNSNYLLKLEQDFEFTPNQLIQITNSNYSEERIKFIPESNVVPFLLNRGFDYDDITGVFKHIGSPIRFKELMAQAPD
jgi:hypothetical protein